MGSYQTFFSYEDMKPVFNFVKQGLCYFLFFTYCFFFRLLYTYLIGPDHCTAAYRLHKTNKLPVVFSDAVPLDCCRTLVVDNYNCGCRSK